MKNSKPALVFVVVTCLITWAVVFGYTAIAGKWTPSVARILGWVSMLLPALVAIPVNRFMCGQKWFGGLGFSVKINDWWYAAAAFPFVLALSATAIGLLFPGVQFAPKVSGQVFMVLLFQWIFGGLSFFGLLGLGEQIGWRGVLYRAFSGMSFWKASFLIGLLWGVWQAPFVMQGSLGPTPLIYQALLTIGWCILISPVIQLIRIKTDSILPVALAIGLINTTFQLPFVLTYGGSTIMVGITGIAGLIILAIIDIGVLVYQRKSPDTFAKVGPFAAPPID